MRTEEAIDLTDMNECDLDKTEKDAANNVLLDEKKTENHVRKTEKETQRLAKKTCYQNLGILSISFLLLFSAYNSLQHLQSSMYTVDGIRNTGFVVLNITFMVSCLFLPPFILSKIGMKKTMLFSMFGYVFYTVASFYVCWWTIIPASVVLGIVSSTLWTGLMSYATQLARIYSDVTRAKLPDSCSRFFGIFFTVYFTGYAWGHLASTLFFPYQRRVNVIDDQTGYENEVYTVEGLNNTNLLVPDEGKVYGFLGGSLGFGLLAIILTSILLDDLKSTRKTKPSLLGPLTDTLRHFWRSGYQKLLVPVTIYRGLSTGFLILDFNSAFTSINPGVHNVAYIMICYGISSSLASYIHGVTARLTGYHVPFIAAFLLHIGTGIALFIWTPRTDSAVPFYAIVCVWSVGNAVYSAVLTPLYSNLFPDSTDAAMSSFNLLSSIGVLLSFGVSSFVSGYVKLVLILVFLVISTVCVLVVILHDKWYAKPYNLVSAIDLAQRDIGRITSIPK